MRVWETDVKVGALPREKLCLGDPQICVMLGYNPWEFRDEGTGLDEGIGGLCPSRPTAPHHVEPK